MWKPHFFHVATTWFPHRHHVVSMHTTWLPCGYYVVPCAHHVVSRWTSFGFQIDTMWFPGGQHRVSKVDTMWFLQDTTGFPHGCHVMSIWTPCVVEVTTWKPVQKTALHEANCLPCYFLQWRKRKSVNLVFRDKEFGSFCHIWQIWIVIFWSCADVKGNDKNQ